MDGFQVLLYNPRHMCGIAGIVNKNVSNKEKTIGEMVSLITHRGPDEDGFLTDECVGLGMRRLSIIDLSSGKQPIYSTDGKKVIFFNGEIYNYKELREELVKSGTVFKTHSDTEVILALYEKMGEKSLNKLRGMFGFVIYNLETKEAFVARDHFGIKPLYYVLDDSKKIRNQKSFGHTRSETGGERQCCFQLSVISIQPT